MQPTEGAPAESTFEADVKRYHTFLLGLGLSANPAAAYAVKWATRSSVPVSVKGCLDRCKETPLGAAVAEALSRDFQALFRNADTIFMSMLLFSHGAEAAPESYDGPSGSGRLDMDAIFAALTKLYGTLRSSGSEAASLGVITRLLTPVGSGALAQSLKWVNAEAQAAILVILLLLPPLDSVDHYEDVMVPLLALVEAARHICAQQLHAELKRLSGATMRHIVFVLQQFMTIRLYRTRTLDVHISRCCNLLQVLHDANQHLKDLISYTDFYNDVVNSPDFALDEDYKRWRSPGPPQFCFCRFPFLYGPAAKAKILQFDCAENQMGEIANSFMGLNPGHHRSQPYLVLHVRRGEYMVEDALMQIQAAVNADALRKPLKVKFLGEQGVDEGGVAKEFFELLMRQCFQPQFGMFSYDEENTQLHWFVPSTLGDLSSNFDMIGVMVGLAIYNSHLVDFSFPLATYKKLLNRPVGLDDLREVHEDIHRTLLELLKHPADDVEADMGLTFQISHAMDFTVQTVDLVPDGANIPVTGANRREFVNRYVDFLLNQRIKAQFDAFKAGFQRLCAGPVIDMFNEQELELLICGSTELDFHALQRATVYDSGYSADTDVVEWFWKAVHEYDEDLKKKLLRFVTSSHRMPIDGPSALNPPFRIARNGPHSNRLPTAHTCFNILLLPQYRSEADLRDRLTLAITVDNSEGFGLM